MTARESAAERRIERRDSGRRHLARHACPRRCRRQRDIELACAEERFEVGPGGVGHVFRFLFASGGEYSAPSGRDQEEVKEAAAVSA